MQRGNFLGKDMLGHAVQHSDVSCAKIAKPFEMSFGLWTLIGPRKHVLHEGAHWRHLANTIESFKCGGDAVFLSN